MMVKPRRVVIKRGLEASGFNIVFGRNGFDRASDLGLAFHNVLFD